MHEFIKMKFNLREGEQFPQGHSSLSYLPVLGLQLRHTGSLVVAREILAVARGIRFPDQRSNLGPLHWEHRDFTTGPPGTCHGVMAFYKDDSIQENPYRNQGIF